MILCEEFYFEITLKGKKSEIKKFAKFLKSGGLEDFFEVSSDYINYSDDFAAADESEDVEMIFTNDDFGIEIQELDTDEFLELLCQAAESLEVFGHLYDINDEEFNFISERGDSYYLNSRKIGTFNDELDEAARREEYDDD